MFPTVQLIAVFFCTNVQPAERTLNGCSPCLNPHLMFPPSHHLMSPHLTQPDQEVTHVLVPPFQAPIRHLQVNWAHCFMSNFENLAPSAFFFFFLCINILTSGLLWLGRQSVSLSRTKLHIDMDRDDPAPISKRTVGLLAN